VYDVRVRRELAHRRFVVSIVRQALRLISLHALDAIAVSIAFFIARALSDVSVSANVLPSITAFVLVGLNVRGSYRAGAARRDGERLFTGVLVAVVLMAIPGTLRQFTVSPAFITTFALAAIAGLIVERRIVDSIVHQAYVHGFGLRRALLVARPHETTDLLAGLIPLNPRDDQDDHVVVGHVTPDHLSDSSALGTLSDLERIIDEKDISELLVGTSLRGDVLSDISEVCFERGVRVLVIPPAPNTLRGWAELTQVGRWPAYQLHPPRLELPQLILKRGTDLLLATVGLIFAIPAITLIGLAIKIESRGPVFFRQRRVGLGGREFMMWKFRSMYNEAEMLQHEIAHLNRYGDAPLFKLPRDPRITKTGRFLRRFSLDELPQLVNILGGDMSLVGPRPPLPSEVKRYESRHYIRLTVVPGLTGPWQVNGRNLITDFEEIIRLEREYIEKWSLRSDLEIMARTLGVVISGKGAY
jgi:exopolysaccharide biosynthesis polyprenyl glycosylphosphotransferase